MQAYDFHISLFLPDFKKRKYITFSDKADGFK